MPSFLPTLLVVFCDFFFFFFYISTSPINLYHHLHQSGKNENSSKYLTYSFVRLVSLDQVDVLLFGP